MDTNIAIQTLNSALSSMNGNISGFQDQANALTLAIGLLNGTLATQLQTVTNAQFVTLPQAITLQASLDAANAEIVTLSTPTDTTTS